jgi:hypothetical protein
MPSGETVPVGVDFIYRVQNQNPFIVNNEFPIIIASRLTAP